jgi:hypothetical protein
MDPTFRQTICACFRALGVVKQMYTLIERAKGAAVSTQYFSVLWLIMSIFFTEKTSTYPAQFLSSLSI